MNLSKIKSLLASENISANQVNPIIDYIEIQQLGELTALEKGDLRELINNMLLLSQDKSSGAYVNNPDKAESILEALD